MTSSDLLQRAASTAPRIAPHAARIETDRRLVPEVVRLLQEARAFHLTVPRALGGEEAPPETVLAILETLAAGDGSTGWCAMIGATCGLMSGYAPEPTARTIWGAPDAITCGVFAPMGRARREPGGFRISGRWPFASGCDHAAFRMGGFLVEGDPPDVLPSGAPHVRSALFPAADTRILDTWHTLGLRGTGSHDFEVKDVFVPEERTFSFFTTKPWAGGPLYRVPPFGFLAAGVAAVALGIGRGALDALGDLAGSKRPGGGKKTLAHRELVQLSFARAEAMLGAGRAGLFAAMTEVTRAAERGEQPPAIVRARLRAAASHAAAEAARAVDLLYEAGGGSAIYAESPLQRAFRDVHTATQHLMVQPSSTVLAGRVLLGVDTDVSTL